MITIYDPQGKRVTASEEDAAVMVAECGYSREWPPEAKAEPAPMQPEPAQSVEAPAEEVEEASEPQPRHGRRG
jgi:hypothetical protein